MTDKDTVSANEQKIRSDTPENAAKCTMVSTTGTDENTEPDKLLYVQQAQDFFHEPVENENTVFALVASGEVEKILENKLRYDADPDSGKGQLSDDPLRNQIYHLVICAALVARACLAAGMSEESAYTLSDLYIQRADKCTTVKQVMELNDDMMMDYAGRMRSLRRTKRLSVPVRSHLHRLFKAEIGMGIHEYISAVRINAAKGMLRDGDHSIADIASLLGFSSQSHFCRAFSKAVGVTPKEYKDSKRP